MLTASKLSTVAMLAMAAVLHFSVSAVPMEHTDVQEVAIAQVAPVVRAPPDYSAYKSSEGNPSEQAIKDMDAILDALLPPDEEYGLSFFSEEPQPASSPSGDKNKKDVNRMNLKELKELARENQDQFNAIEKRLPHLTEKLNAELDKAWVQFEKQVRLIAPDEWSFKEVIRASSAWEDVVKDVFDLDQLEECPYDQLPYNRLSGRSVEQLQGQLPSEEELLDVAKRNSAGYKAYVRNNVCRLVVNGAYPWLMRILAMHSEYSDNQILSVLGQLKLFTPDKAFAHDLDELLKLFAAISKADGKKATIPTEITHLLMLSTPEIIPALNFKFMSMTEALFLYFAATHHEEGSDTHQDVDEMNLLKAIKIGDINDTVHYYYLDAYFVDQFGGYLLKLIDSIFEPNYTFHTIKRTAINNLLDLPSTGLKIDERTGQVKCVDMWCFGLNPFEMLVNALSLDQFVRLYGSMPDKHKGLQLVIMAGRSRQGPEIMEYLFKDVLGEDKGIKDGVQVHGEQLTANHLAQLVQGCAIACTKKNWLAFVDLFIKKVKDTKQLSGINSSSATIAQQVSGEISKLAMGLGLYANEIEFKDDLKRKKEATDVVDEVTALMSHVREMLGADGHGPVSPTKRAA